MQLTLLTDRSQGVGSIADGEMEIMVSFPSYFEMCFLYFCTHVLVVHKKGVSLNELDYIYV